MHLAQSSWHGTEKALPGTTVCRATGGGYHRSQLLSSELPLGDTNLIKKTSNISLPSEAWILEYNSVGGLRVPSDQHMGPRKF